MTKLQQLIAHCKAGVYLTVNGHLACYRTTAEELVDMARRECPPEVSAEVRAGILRKDTIVDLVCYPNTPIGSYQVIHYEVEAALAEMLEILGRPATDAEVVDEVSGVKWKVDTDGRGAAGRMG